MMTRMRIAFEMNLSIGFLSPSPDSLGCYPRMSIRRKFGYCPEPFLIRPVSCRRQGWSGNAKYGSYVGLEKVGSQIAALYFGEPHFPYPQRSRNSAASILVQFHKPDMLEDI